MSGEEQLQLLRRRYDEIADALSRAERGGDAHEQERLRHAIVALFREADAQIEQLAAFRDGIRPLVERYRALFRADEAPPAVPPAPVAPPPASAPAPAPVRVDHLGASTYIERGWNAIAGASYELALRELDRALALAPGDARAEALLGWALMRLGRHAEARRLLEGLLARDPEHALARTNLGYVSFREGRFAEAIEHLSRALRGAGNRTATLYANLYLGMVYSEREMYRDARSFFLRALEQGPNLVEAYWELGRAHYREGARDLALQAWKHGAQTNRFNPWGERCGQAAARLAAGEAVSLD